MFDLVNGAAFPPIRWVGFVGRGELDVCPDPCFLGLHLFTYTPLAFRTNALLFLTLIQFFCLINPVCSRLVQIESLCRLSYHERTFFNNL